MIKKIQRHENQVTINPPRVGPIRLDTPHTRLAKEMVQKAGSYTCFSNSIDEYEDIIYKCKDVVSDQLAYNNLREKTLSVAKEYTIEKAVQKMMEGLE